MMTKSMLLPLFCLCVLAVHVHSLDLPLLTRLVRAAGVSTRKSDCRYEKSPWEECDYAGVQKRVLKLRNGQSNANDCEAEKLQTRPCKKACRYTKGTWSECENGQRVRKDSLKAQTAGCDSERTISRKCKTVCRYSRADWGPCESMMKSKTLTLVEGNPSECESTKKITKQCPSTTTGKPNSQRSKDKSQRNQNKSHKSS